MAEIGRKILKLNLLSWIHRAFMADRERWAMWVPVLLGCGIGLYFSLSFEPPLWLGWLVSMVLGGASWFMRRRYVGCSLFFLALTFVALGLGVSGVRTWLVNAPVLQAEIGPVHLEGQVLKIEARPKGMRVTLGHLNLERVRPDAMPKTVRVTLSATQPHFVPGDWLSVRASLSPPPPPASPNAFDFQRQSFFRGLGGVGFSYGRAKVIGHGPLTGISSLSFALERMRLSISQKIRQSLKGSKGAVAAALMTGDRGAIPKTVLEDMRVSGLAHLLAISGLHVGLITGIVFFSIRAFLALIPSIALRYPIKKWAAVCAILGAGGYAIMAGATVPTQRAFLMIGLVLMGVLFDRRTLSMRLVAWAAVVILMISPESLLGASFQLSFAAVVALISVYETVSKTKLFNPAEATLMRKITTYVISIGLTTLVAGLATSIFAAYHFNRVAEYSLAANMLAVPITALWVMPWAVVTYVFMLVGWEAWPLSVMGWGVDGVLTIANTVAHWSGATQEISAFPFWGLVLVSLGGLWVAIWRGRWRLIGMPFALLGLLSIGLGDYPDVLINRTGTLVAVRTPTGGYQVSSLRASGFERDVWLRRSGLKQADGRWPKNQRDLKGDLDPFIRCDDLGCIFKKNSQTVAFSKRPESLMDDCRQDRIVVNLTQEQITTPCMANLIIDVQDLRDQGAHALYFTDTGVRVETVAQKRGQRPWVLRFTKNLGFTKILETTSKNSN